ncbi:MAG: hypothetical protein ACOYXB_01245 [Bacteroidota bacterium]
MKKTATLLFSLIVLSLITGSCDDNQTFTQMKAIENMLFMKIRDYRAAENGSTLAVNLDTMVKEAQLYSYKMANGVVDVGTAGLAEHWEVIHDHWGGTNDVSVVLLYPTDGVNPITADMIFSAMTADSAINQALLSDVSICGIGIESDSIGNAYVTYLAMLVE